MANLNFDILHNNFNACDIKPDIEILDRASVFEKAQNLQKLAYYLSTRISLLYCFSCCQKHVCNIFVSDIAIFSSKNFVFCQR